MARPLIRGLTIDPVGSKDLDDAVWVDETPDGFVARVSIADATSWVPIGSKADLVAHEKLVSRYYRKSTDHLLPIEIATDLGSLLPGQPRRALTVAMCLDSSLEIKGQPEISLTYVESTKLSYSDIPEILRNPSDPLFNQVGLLSGIAKAISKQRGKRTPIPFYDLPKGLIVTEEGIPREIPANETTAHVIVREMMVLANATLARFCANHHVPMIYRTHVLRKGFVDLAGFVAQNGDGKLDLKRIRLVQQQMGLVIPRAKYDITPHHHSGLGLPMYTHGTSPLRRRADMIVHRQLKAWLKRRDYPYGSDDLRLIVDHINDRASEMDESNAYMHRRWEPKMKASLKPIEILNEWSQQFGGGMPSPTYTTKLTKDHVRPYVAVCTMGNLKRTGRGRTSDEAKRSAARAVYDVLFAGNR